MFIVRGQSPSDAFLRRTMCRRPHENLGSSWPKRCRDCADWWRSVMDLVTTLRSFEPSELALPVSEDGVGLLRPGDR